MSIVGINNIKIRYIDNTALLALKRIDLQNFVTTIKDLGVYIELANLPSIA